MADVKRNSILSPIIVLVCIGLVASFLLAAVYQMTAPIISEREAETKNAALKLVLPDASSFTKMDIEELEQGVTEVYKADNGSGIVCSTNCKSQQGGEIVMMVGVNSQGAVNGISVISHNETAGIGDKVLQESYFSTLYGLDSVEAVAAADVISGATKTSNCVKESAQVALAQYAKVGTSVDNSTEKTYEEKLIAAINKLTDNANTTLLADIALQDGVKEVYKVAGDLGYVAIVNSGSVTAAVLVDTSFSAASEIIEGTADSATTAEICSIAIEQIKSI